MKDPSAAYSGGTVRDSHPIVLFSLSGAADCPAQATERMVFYWKRIYAERSPVARMAAEAASGV